MLVYRYTKEELEEFADNVKSGVLRALVNESFIPEDKADEWCKSHTVIVRDHNCFATFLSKLTSADPKKAFLIVVKEI